MKSEHRHELQTNILANQAGKAIEQAKPYTAMTLGGIGLFAVVAVGLAVWHNSSQRANSNAWINYYFANGRSDDLIPVYEDFPGSTAADWARIGEADSRMEEALDLVFRDRKLADELFQKAKKNYESVADASSQPALRARATFGLAQVLESLGDVEKASSTYKKLQQMEAVTPNMATEVKRRLEWLQGSDAKSFFAWFKDFSPAPASPLSLPPLNNLPGTPDINFPTIPNATPTNGSTAAPTNPTEQGTPASSTGPDKQTSGVPTEKPVDGTPQQP